MWILPICSLLLSVFNSHYNFPEVQTSNPAFANDCYASDFALKPEMSGPSISNENYAVPSSIQTNYLNCFPTDYYSVKHFDMVSYFANLVEFCPANNLGSCGYVSLIQLLSYFDTFKNDDVIPEQYDETVLTESWEEAALRSPGVERNSFSNGGGLSYMDFCYSHRGTDLQSELTVIFNELSKNVTAGSFEPGIHLNDYNKLLNCFYGEEENPFYRVGYGDAGTIDVSDPKVFLEFEDQVKKFVQSGMPVVAHIGVPNQQSVLGQLHSVVVYDIDASGNLYANFGWGNGDTQKKLFEPGGYEYIYAFCAYDLKTNIRHKHSNNYIVDNEHYCGCNFVDKPGVLTGGEYDNIPSTFFWMKDRNNADEFFQVSVLKNGFSNDAYFSLDTDFNAFTLPMNVWESILASKATYYVRIKRYWNDLFISEDKQIFGTPKSGSLIATNINVSELSITEQFFDSEITKPAFISGGIFTYKYLRSSLIDGSLCLSSNKIQKGKAYIEFSYFKPIMRVDFKAFLWSLNENVDATHFEVQYKNSQGTWISFEDIILDLPSGKSNSEPFSYIIPVKTSSVRFYSYTNNSQSEMDSGRVGLEGLKFYA